MNVSDSPPALPTAADDKQTLLTQLGSELASMRLGDVPDADSGAAFWLQTDPPADPTTAGKFAATVAAFGAATSYPPEGWPWWCAGGTYTPVRVGVSPSGQPDRDLRQLAAVQLVAPARPVPPDGPTHTATLIPDGDEWRAHPGLWRHTPRTPLLAGPAHPAAVLATLRHYGQVGRWPAGSPWLWVLTGPVVPAQLPADPSATVSATTADGTVRRGTAGEQLTAAKVLQRLQNQRR